MIIKNRPEQTCTFKHDRNSLLFESVILCSCNNYDKKPSINHCYIAKVGLLALTDSSCISIYVCKSGLHLTNDVDVAFQIHNTFLRVERLYCITDWLLYIIVFIS